MNVLPSAIATRVLSYAGGQVLRAATAVVAVRPAAKPLHPHGAVGQGTLRRLEGTPRSGVAWLDDPGERRVLVRHSRALGLPAPFPDVFGLALRVPTGEGRRADLLFASTGLGRVTRFALTAARSPQGRPMTTLLPYRTPVGAVVLSAVFRGPTHVDLAWAVGAGAWNPFAELVLDQGPQEDQPDQLVSFDPVRNPPPGLDTYDWVRRLREPAYLTARRSRRT